tara:strand:- start:1134 stop:2654 length:1521 start_codon:yes stop_codon:yes gene_type:complete
MKSKLVLIVSTLVFFSCIDKEKQIESPNFIFILADDLGYGELGVFGQKIIETPNIDQLAKDGMILTSHYSGSPVCAPARAILLTGLHAGHSPVRGNDEWKERGDVWSFEAMFKNPELEGQRPMPDSIITVASYLKSNGYKTGMVGKWGLGAPNTNSVPNNKGFDFFYGYNCQRQAHTLYPSHLWKNTKRDILKNIIVNKGPLKEGLDPNNSVSYKLYNQNAYAPTLMHNQGLKFIERNKDNKFFLYYASPLPHLPLQAPKKWVDYYREIIGQEEPYIGDNGYYPNQFPKSTYAAMISYLDEQVGEIISKLKEIGKYKNTIIVFTSDNGPTHVKQVNIDFFNSAGAFVNSEKTVKGSVNEGGIRVPTIVTWPSKIKGGTKSDHPSTFYDFFATVSDIIGKPMPNKTDGISYLPSLIGKKQIVHEYLYWEFPAYGGQQAIRINQWKGIKKNLLKGPSKLDLYNLKNDPKELNNIANKNPEIINRMERLLKQAHTKASIEKFNMPYLDE